MVLCGTDFFMSEIQQPISRENKLRILIYIVYLHIHHSQLIHIKQL